MLRCISPYFWIILSFVTKTVGNASNARPGLGVSTPSQFQEAVRAGIKHVVIKDHLDMRNTAKFSYATKLDTGMIAIVANARNQYTSSIRVRLKRFSLVPLVA